jgi:hypothetical protein
MMNLKEYEIRLFDGFGSLMLVAPITATGHAAADARGRELEAEHGAARHQVVGQMASVRFAGARAGA